MSEYSEMTYRELQAAAKEAGVDAKGTKEELLARLEGGVETADEPEVEEAAPETEPEVEEKAVSDREVENALRSDQRKMKAHLDEQPKVSVMIPFEAGVAPETAEKIPFVVNLNGYRLAIKRGTFVEVPKQVAEIVQERLESEGKIGSQFKISNDPAKMEALG